MKSTTGLGIVIAVLLYFIALFIFFSISPPELIAGHSMSGVQLNPLTSTNSTADSQGQSALTTFSQFSSFGIEGIPTWLVILAVYAPTVLLALGMYGLVRGI